GYAIVIGVIFSITSGILFFQEESGNKGKYAELIKDNVLYRVIEVLDGDTLIANVSGKEVTVRLIGIDTPEVVDPRKPVQCYGPQASAKAKEILSNREVYLEKEKSKGKGNKQYDIYGRVLAYAHLPSGMNYNQFMIENGFAKEYTFNSEKYKYQKEFKEAHKKAKKEKLGLWGACTT
ncbi:MAG: thermonuclease family protein, partial [bacterium]|nr:thermonuclease family protein [bacterium]